MAIKSEEYVPTKIPMRMANINPLITTPPKIKMINNTNNVVIDVLMVRLNVVFNEALMVWSNGTFFI